VAVGRTWPAARIPEARDGRPGRRHIGSSPKTGFSSQQDNRPERADRAANLWEPADGPTGHDYTAHGSFDNRSKSPSAQLWASQNHGLLAAMAGALAVTGAVVGLRGRP
jgi:hypothetical protein